MRCFTVYYQLRRGLGPDWTHKERQIFFDDIDPETTDSELITMTRNEFTSEMKRSEDYHQYGENWIIDEIRETSY